MLDFLLNPIILFFLYIVIIVVVFVLLSLLIGEELVTSDNQSQKDKIALLIICLSVLWPITPFVLLMSVVCVSGEALIEKITNVKKNFKAKREAKKAEKVST